LRQLAFSQKIPSSKARQTTSFCHHEPEALLLGLKITVALKNIACKGKMALGKQLVKALAEYQDWLEKRIKGNNLTFIVQEPLLSKWYA